jgi:hypothetical protein
MKLFVSAPEFLSTDFVYIKIISHNLKVPPLLLKKNTFCFV